MRYFKSAALCAVICLPPMALAQDLTGDIWSVCGDDGFATWHDTRLVFTDQRTTDTDEQVNGYFDWRSSDGYQGREHFIGFIAADGTLALQGLELEDAEGIVTSRYLATVADGGKALIEGVWLDGQPGVWAAVRDGGQGGGQTLCDRTTPTS